MKKRHLALIALLSIFVSDLFAADPDPLDWVKQTDGGYDWGMVVATDGDGNSIVAGSFSNTAVDFGGGTTISKIGGTDLFVAKYDSSGTVLWARRDGGVALSFATCVGTGIATDANGDILVTGYYARPVTFGAGETNETALDRIGPSTNNANNIFVAKYSGSSGELLWARRAGGLYHDEALGISADAAGNSCVTGYVGGTVAFAGGPLDVVFGEGEANETTLGAWASNNIFVAKYDPSGDLVWAKLVNAQSIITIGDVDYIYGGYDYGRDTAIDENGDCLVTGQFNYGATFGPGESNATFVMASPLDGGGLYDDDYDEMFVAKYSGSDGELQWVKKTESDWYNQGWGVATDGSDNAIVTGLSAGTATFGAGEANQTTLASVSGGDDIFVAKYGEDGSLSWARKDGGAGGDWSYGIDTDNSGNIYVTGDFSGTATFGALETEETILTSSGSSDIFIAKYEPSGFLQWAKNDGSSYGDSGYSVALDPSGNAFVTGSFKDVATFGYDEPNETDLTKWGGNYDFFLMKLAGSNEIDVAVDIKPTSCPNPFNVDKNGLVPMAILGAGDFDVTQIDPTSVSLAGIAPLRWAYDDVSTPFEPFVGRQSAFDCNEEGADGLLDITFKFDARELAAALGEVEDGDILVLPVTGNLLEGFGGTPIVGEDVMVILEKR